MIKVSVECRENTRGHLEPGPGQQSFYYLYTWKKTQGVGSLPEPRWQEGFAESDALGGAVTSAKVASHRRVQVNTDPISHWQRVEHLGQMEGSSKAAIASTLREEEAH